MNFYIVFGSTRRPTDFMGGKHLDWGQPPIGVYRAEDATDACIVAAKDYGQMATYFAVEGMPWGVDMAEASAQELGRTVNPNERLTEALNRAEKRVAETNKRAAELQTRKDRLAAAEAKSAEMEREAGIGTEDDGELPT